MATKQLPSPLPTHILRQLLLNLAEDITTDQLAEMIQEEGDAVGSLIFGGGMLDDDEEANFQCSCRSIYDGVFKPFLDEHKIDHVDMYLYMRGQIEEYSDAEEKHIVMALFLSEQLSKYADDYHEAIFKQNFAKFQALWRGHNARWKNPFFTFKD